eukprot:363433-Chlamydomonas_euryale.AAC.25
MRMRPGCQARACLTNAGRRNGTCEASNVRTRALVSVTSVNVVLLNFSVEEQTGGDYNPKVCKVRTEVSWLLAGLVRTLRLALGNSRVLHLTSQMAYQQLGCAGGRGIEATGWR